ncbi:MAG TPA: CvpA family protein [Ignavibacteriaceae bacterium]|nr:CvpA family protein [Ignavibacteriaceae bacterium]
MSILDIIIIVVLLIGFILGYKDGFVRKLVGLIGFGLAIFLAVYFSDDIGRIIESVFGIEIYLASIFAGLLIFWFVIFIFAVLKRIVHPFDKVNNVINRVVGGAVGLIQIAFLMSALFFLLKTFSIPGKEGAKTSLLYERVYNIIPDTVSYLGNYTPDAKEKFKEYILDKDKPVGRLGNQ